MLKKARQAAASDEGKQDAEVGGESTRNIWLAGLGALSRAQAEGMRMFENLVKQGEALESKTRKAASQTAAAAKGAATAKVKEVKDGVGGTWDKLEQVFEARVARALTKLGVHSSADVERLSQRVDRLSDAVNELIKATGAKAPRKTPARTPRKAAQKPVRKPAKRAARKSAKRDAA
jgi:poly(hydroxyalkanoate) granule-associated protein